MKKGERGDVWFAYDEQGKLRPYVIISNEHLVAEVDHVLAKVTSHDTRNKFDVVIEEWKEAGLNRPSIVRCTKLRTIHNQLLEFKTGVLTEHDLNRVLDTLRSYF